MSPRTARAHFDGKARRYHHDIYEGRARNCHAHNQRTRRRVISGLLAELGPPAPGARALDIGAGSGAISSELVRLGYSTTAADLSWNMLVAHREAASDVRQRAQCSVEALGFRSRTFDLVTAAGMLEYVPDQQRALSEFFRVLKPGGNLIVSVPIKTRLSTPLRRGLRGLRGGQTEPGFHLGYTPRAFRQQLMATGFRLVSSRAHHYVFFPWDLLAPSASARFDLWVTGRIGSRPACARLAKTLVLQVRRES